MIPTCDTIRTWLPAYLDGERCPLPADAMERHLSGCEACAAEAASRRAFSNAVHGAYRPHPVPLSLARRVTTARRTRVLQIAAAAMVVLGAGLALARLLAPSSADARSLPQAAVTAHEAVRSQAMGLDIEATSSAELVKKLGERLPFRFHLPPITDPSLKLKGGRVMQVGSSLAGLVVYARGDELVSLTIAPRGTALRLGGDRTETFRKMTFHSSKVGGYSVISWDDGELSYALVAPSPEASRAACAVCHTPGSGLSPVDRF